jgi:hypothetical protein
MGLVSIVLMFGNYSVTVKAKKERGGEGWERAVAGSAEGG